MSWLLFSSFFFSKRFLSTGLFDFIAEKMKILDMLNLFPLKIKFFSSRVNLG